MSIFGLANLVAPLILKGFVGVRQMDIIEETVKLWIEKRPHSMDRILGNLGYVKKEEPEIKRRCGTCRDEDKEHDEEPCKSCVDINDYPMWVAKT